MFTDGIKLYGAQFVLMMPLFLLLGCGILFLLTGSIGFSALLDEGTKWFTPIAGMLLFVGMGSTMLFTLLSLPYGIVLSAAQGHVAAKRSFRAAFEFKEWWQVFRAVPGQFMLAYVVMFVASFIFTFVMQIAMITIILMCILPFLMIPYLVYSILVSNALYAQAYAKGLEKIQPI
jgi:hypothetical protein